jgi:dTDP-4-amino-4,6-dideoxygalactose transaminase
MEAGQNAATNGGRPTHLQEGHPLERFPIPADRPVRDHFLVFGAPDIQEEEIQEVVDTLRSGWIGTGPKCQKFEEMFREYIGCEHAVALNSCTAGLELALEVLDIGPGDDVITTPLTFCATANAIVHRGARPVFVDVDLATANIDPEQVRRAVTPRTKVIMPVHLYGRPCPIDSLMDIARENGLYVIEDAAHAIEARYRGRKIGAIGDFTAFSFYVTKNLTTAEGGMLATGNPVWAEKVRTRRLHGLSCDAWKRYSADGFQPYDVVDAGYKYNMTDIQAALGLHQFARLEKNLEIREDYWQIYNAAFAGMEEITTPTVLSEEPGGGETRHARHLYTILLNLEQLDITRWDFINAMKAENVGTGIHYLALHTHSFYQRHFAYRRGDFPNAEYIADRTVSLPLSPGMSEQDVQDVIRAVKKVIGNGKTTKTPTAQPQALEHQ